MWSAVSARVVFSPGWNRGNISAGRTFIILWTHLLLLVLASSLCNLGQASEPLRASVSAFLKVIATCLRVPVKFGCTNAPKAGAG